MRTRMHIHPPTHIPFSYGILYIISRHSTTTVRTSSSSSSLAIARAEHTPITNTACKLQEDAVEESEQQCTTVIKYVWCRKVLFLAYLLLCSNIRLFEYTLFISSSFLLWHLIVIKRDVQEVHYFKMVLSYNDVFTNKVETYNILKKVGPVLIQKMAHHNYFYSTT